MGVHQWNISGQPTTKWNLSGHRVLQGLLLALVNDQLSLWVVNLFLWCRNASFTKAKGKDRRVFYNLQLPGKSLGRSWVTCSGEQPLSLGSPIVNWGWRHPGHPGHPGHRPVAFIILGWCVRLRVVRIALGMVTWVWNYAPHPARSQYRVLYGTS